MALKTSKQDRTFARTAMDIERKYDFDKSFSEAMNLAEQAKRQADEAILISQNALKELSDIDAEEIFNRLTDNGKYEGIYRDEYGNYYVSATYIGSGIFSAKDAQGKTVFYVNVDTGEVYMNAERISVGEGTTLSDMASKADALQAILSNEYQGIPSDYSGVIGSFPNCQTAIQVIYGNTDVTGNCTISATASSGVTGSLNGTTYTVTDLTTDTGYVDIRAIYEGLTATKRFTISKVKGGIAGRTYFVEPSVTVVKRGQDNLAIPDEVTFSAFYRDGDSASRTAYAGRFVMEVSTDGDRWMTAYTSVEDESSCKYEFFTALQDGYGNYIEDGNGNIIVAWNDETTVMVRCTLYARGGTSNPLDAQTVQTVVDVSELTHEQIFNLLTNDGAWQGLYHEDGHLYLNGEYMKFVGANIGGWDIGELAIYRDVVDSSDTNTIHRVYFQPPVQSLEEPGKTWVLSCQKSTDGGKTFYGSFILYADGSAKFGNTRISSEGSIFSTNPVNGDTDFSFDRTETGDAVFMINGLMNVNGSLHTNELVPSNGVTLTFPVTLSTGMVANLKFSAGILVDYELIV